MIWAAAAAGHGAMGAMGAVGTLRGRCGSMAGTLIDRPRQTKANGLLLAVIVVFD